MIVPFLDYKHEPGLLSVITQVVNHLTVQLRELLEQYDGMGGYDASWRSLEELILGIRCLILTSSWGPASTTQLVWPSGVGLLVWLLPTVPVLACPLLHCAIGQTMMCKRPGLVESFHSPTVFMLGYLLLGRSSFWCFWTICIIAMKSCHALLSRGPGCLVFWKVEWQYNVFVRNTKCTEITDLLQINYIPKINNVHNLFHY